MVRVPKKIMLGLKVFFVLLTLLLLFRCAFFLMFHTTTDKVAISEILYSIYLGIKFDIRFILIVMAPMILLGHVPYLEMGGKRKHEKIIWLSYWAIMIPIIILFYFVHFGTYSYLNTALNSTLLKFLDNLSISMQMVWQSYPVVALMVGLLLITICALVFINKWALKNSNDAPNLSLKRRTITYICAFLLFALGIYGKIAWYPLRWSEAFFAPNRFISAWTVNPVLYFIDTLKFQEKDYDLQKVKEYYEVVADYLGVETPNAETLNFKRTIIPNKKISELVKGGRPPNIVLIVMESMAAYKTGLFANDMNPTPYLDELAKDSVFFSNFYVPSQATARSIFAAVTGNPDLSLKKTASRNPVLVNQHSIINEFKDHEKYYFIGGSANWGNIRGIFTNNIKNIKVYEEGAYSSPRMDVWGISDYHLFIEANKILKEKTDPFFAIIQSASFHRPYTIPEDKGEYKIQEFNTDEEIKKLQSYGFLSAEEYNSLKFQDYALGNFIALAKQEKYYENTIFVIYGDHGLPDYGAINVSEGRRKIEVAAFHVPLIFHGPKFLDRSESKKMASQLDVLPSIASLLGVPYTNTTLGRDLFNEKFDNERYAFTYYWYNRPEKFGLLDENYYYLADTEQKSELHKYVDFQEDTNVSKSPSESKRFKRMEELAKGLFYTAKYLMFHNPKINE